MKRLEDWLDENSEYKEKYDAMTDEERKQLSEAAEKVESIVNATFLIVKRAAEALNKFLDEYPNKRVMHLALHSKKKKIRKKNMNRIKKDMKRYVIQRDLTNG